MVTYAVNMASVQQIAEEMHAVSEQIQVLLGDLERDTTKHLAHWTSSARETYAAAKARWDTAAADMALQATNAHNSLSQIVENYAQAERQGMSMWGG